MNKIEISNLNLHYGNFHALKNINLDIQEKEITAFIGPSGCGKSTLLKSINRMNDLVEGCKIEGKMLLDGEDIYRNMDTALLRKRVKEIDPNAIVIGEVWEDASNKISYDVRRKYFSCGGIADRCMGLLSCRSGSRQIGRNSSGFQFSVGFDIPYAGGDTGNSASPQQYPAIA